VARVRYYAAPHVIRLLERTIRATETDEKIEVRSLPWLAGSATEFSR
jgi:hypothetical protein